MTGQGSTHNRTLPGAITKPKTTMQNIILDAVDRSDFDPTWTGYKSDRRMGDPWGNAMQLWFAIADYIWHETQYVTPGHWEYRAGAASAVDELEDYDPWLYRALHEADIETLIHTGNVLERYTRMLGNAGFAY